MPGPIAPCRWGKNLTVCFGRMLGREETWSDLRFRKFSLAPGCVEMGFSRGQIGKQRYQLGAQHGDAGSRCWGLGLRGQGNGEETDLERGG